MSSNIHQYIHKAIADTNGYSDIAEVFCDRGDESEIAIYIQYGNKTFLYVLDCKLESLRAKLNIERYIAVYLARSLHIRKMNLHINGVDVLEDELKLILEKDFEFAALEIVGKNLNFRNGFRVTSELLYFCSNLKLHSGYPVCFQLNEERPLEVNEILAAISKQHIQIKTFKYVTEEIHEIARYSEAYFWFQLAFFVRSQDIRYLTLNPIDVTYGVGVAWSTLKGRKEPEQSNLQECFEIEAIEDDESDLINKKLMDEMSSLLE